MASRFTIDNHGVAELMLDDMIRGVVDKACDRIKAAAEATAPVGDAASDPHPGEYRDSFHKDVSIGLPYKGERRWIGEVSNSAPHAAAVEYGYSGRHDSPGRNAHFTLTRAIDAARE